MQRLLYINKTWWTEGVSEGGSERKTATTKAAAKMAKNKTVDNDAKQAKTLHKLERTHTHTHRHPRKLVCVCVCVYVCECVEIYAVENNARPTLRAESERDRDRVLRAVSFKTLFALPLWLLIGMSLCVCVCVCAITYVVCVSVCVYVCFCGLCVDYITTRCIWTMRRFCCPCCCCPCLFVLWPTHKFRLFFLYLSIPIDRRKRGYIVLIVIVN